MCFDERTRLGHIRSTLRTRPSLRTSYDLILRAQGWKCSHGSDFYLRLAILWYNCIQRDGRWSLLCLASFPCRLLHIDVRQPWELPGPRYLILFYSVSVMDPCSMLAHSAADVHSGGFRVVIILCKASTNIPIKSLWGNTFYSSWLQNGCMSDIPGTFQTVCQTIPFYIPSHHESSSCPHTWQNLWLFVNSLAPLILNQLYIYRKG